MIRVIYCMRRKPDMSHEAFLHHWRHVHAPMVLANQAALRICAYTQRVPLTNEFSARIERPGRALDRFDGVAELCWDTEAAFREALSSPEAVAAQRALAADEANFIDVGASARWVCHADTLHDGSASA
ncbi:MAG TPA: EthD domain-containing protein [Burkholderiaceae bacterium]|nr:EthD domain-containing protein [Burkholderiaceae bacterium]